MLLYGKGGHAKVIMDCLQALGLKVSYFFDDNKNKQEIAAESPTLPYDPTLFPHEDLIICIGDNLIRKTVAQRIKHSIGKVIHPLTIISPSAKVNAGTMVVHGAIIQCNTSIGKHCIINTGAIVDHDSVIGDFVHLAPRATICGNVTIGEGTLIGAAAVIIPGITIGKWCVIGAGSVITANVPDFSIMAGNPGKLIQKVALEV